MGQPQGVDPEHFQSIASYSSDPNRYLGNTYPITTRDGGDAHAARVKSYRDVFEEYVTHPEPKSAAPDGKACDRTTRGLLTRRHVYAASIYHVGKESNFLEELDLGLVHNLDEMQQKYLDPNEDPWIFYLVPVLKLIPRAELARQTALSERFIQVLRNQTRIQPSRKTSYKAHSLSR